jgi:hypothetical protein
MGWSAEKYTFTFKHALGPEQGRDFMLSYDDGRVVGRNSEYKSFMDLKLDDETKEAVKNVLIAMKEKKSVFVNARKQGEWY